ncbi:MAG: Amino acid permease [uncultured Thiotrichaceae bacterium]|uniref:Amino acid permease n=1 Tax=uncultured Thiotrichaceae bacterium TaxID=298394 RepID=A0A6S6SLX5_9GAMM|nr:MAG: Amino acid permease [uncultured Thiotrichaceae bacterium]
MESSQKKVGLKRSVGLWLLVFYGLGNILGAGIYVLIGKVSGEAGYFAPIAFMLAALVAAFTAFTYAELSSRYPVSAGEAVYLQEGFGWAWLSTMVGLLIAFAGMLSAATIVRGFSGYIQVFSDLPTSIVVIGVLFLLGLIAIWGISESVKVAAFLTGLEIFGLLLIIAVGSKQLSTLPEVISTLPSLSEGYVWSGIFMGAFLAFYAFIGFEDMVNVAEEVKEPEKNMPRAILIALIVSTLLYALVSLVAVVNLSPAELKASAAPLADIYTSATGNKPVLITFISIFAVINGALIQIIMAARVFYGMSRQGWIPAFFSRVSKRSQTPVIATVFVVLVISLLAVWFPLQKLAEATSSLILIIFFMVNIALLKIRKQQAPPEGVRTYPVWVPIIGAIGSLLLLMVKVL